MTDASLASSRSKLITLIGNDASAEEKTKAVPMTTTWPIC